MTTRIQLYEDMLRYITHWLALTEDEDVEQQIVKLEQLFVTEKIMEFTTITDFLEWYTNAICESNGIYSADNTLYADTHISLRLKKESIMLWCKYYLIQQRVNIASQVLIDDNTYKEHITTATKKNKYDKPSIIQKQYLVKCLHESTLQLLGDSFCTLALGTIYVSITQEYILNIYTWQTCTILTHWDVTCHRIKKVLLHAGHTCDLKATGDDILYNLHKTLMSANRCVYTTEIEPMMEFIRDEVKDTSLNSVFDKLKQSCATLKICDHIDWNDKYYPEGLLRVYMILKVHSIPIKLYINHELCYAFYDPNPFLWITSARYQLGHGVYGYGYQKTLKCVNAHHKHGLMGIVFNVLKLYIKLNPTASSEHNLLEAIFTPEKMKQTTNRHFFLMLSDLVSELHEEEGDVF